jgi:MFS family permease
LWSRELPHYPGNKTRYFNLGLVVAITIVLYYQNYLAGGLSTHIMRTFHMSFAWYVNMVVVGYLVGACASFAAGLADRFGRANLVIGGVLIAALLSIFGIPNAHSQLTFGIVFVAIGFVEGVVLVATPALIRDFSPQVGRASAMGFWTLGPVLGSLVVSMVVSNSSDTMPWQDQYIICGIVALVVSLVAAFCLRELAPALRDQLMVSARDRALLEARAKGVDVEASTQHPFRQVLKPDVVSSAIAISVFLIIYYLAVGYFPVFFQTVFGFSQSTANSLGNWFWAAQALALLLAGFISDKTRVRKPFMLFGAIGAIITTSLFAILATHPQTHYSTFVLLLTLIAVFVGITYSPWMASFTETVERRSPALVASGLAVWGLTIRVVIAMSAFFLPHVINTVTTLVADGPVVKAAVAGKDPALNATENATVKAVAADPTIVVKTKSLATKFAPELATAAKIDPSTKAALVATPANPLTQAKAVSEISGLPVTTVVRVVTLGKQGDLSTADKAFLAVNAPKVQDAAGELKALGAVPAADKQYLATWGPALKDPKVQASLKELQAKVPGVKQAKHDSPQQWQTYFWVAVGGQVVFIPLIFVMAGFWDPRKARKQQQEHEARVNAELAKIDA